MHNIYNYNRTLAVDKKDIFKLLYNDELILEYFSILEKIEYQQEEKRAENTQFRICLSIIGKSYCFKSKITEYNEPTNITVETYTKYGTIISHLNLKEHNKNTELNIQCAIGNLNPFARTILTVTQSLIKIALNQSIDNLLNHLEGNSK